MYAPSSDMEGEPVALKFQSTVCAWFPSGQVKSLTPRSGIYYQSCINPAGTHVVFSGGVSGVVRIWCADIATGEMTALSPDNCSARHPAYSANGDRIVYASDERSGQTPERLEDLEKSGLPPADHIDNLFVMGADGEGGRQVTFGPFQDQRPCFSPDGKTIAFISNRGASRCGLWAVPSDGSCEPRLIFEPGQKQRPEGSPPRAGGALEDFIYRPWYSLDGKKIYAFSDVTGRHQICWAPSTGGDVTPLSNDDLGQSHGPFADPDGKHLLMHSDRDGRWGIWSLPLDGGPPQRLDPPGVPVAGHATRSRNGIIAFDVPR